jgi:PAS domain S-box-containing protein
MLEPIRVLHFEDNPADVRLFKEYLKEASDEYVVQSAGRLSAGLKLLETGTYDIVLLDLGMPDGSGIECLRRIRPFAPDIPILVLSGERDEHLARKTVHEGAQDYLIKGDISARALVRSIDYAIERKQSERRILHLNSILRSIQAIDRLIVRERDEQKLLQGACDILHAEGKFSITWIGLLSRSSNRVVPAAAAGLDIGIVRRHTITTDDKPTGKGPSGTVIGLKETRVFTDLSDKRFDPWRDSIRELGITSGIASPLIIDDVVFGVLNVYSRHPNPFSDEEAALIEEVARDLSFAVTAIRARQEKERMARSLREEEERFRTLIDNLNDIVFNVDQEGYITYISPIVTQIADRTPAEIIGRRFDEFLDEHQSNIIGEHFRDILTGKQTLFEIKLKDKDNNDRYFRISSRLQSVEGRVTGVCGTMSDITEKRRAEAELIRTNEALHETGRILKAILDNIPDIAWLKDAESRFIAVNKPLGTLCGFAPEDLVGKTDLDVWPTKLAKRYLADDREVMRSGVAKTFEEPLTDVEGKTRWIETIKTPIYGNNGEIIGTTGIARDITERRLIEERLREQAEILDQINDIVITTDLGGKITSFNKGAERSIGYRADEALGKSIELIYPERQYGEVRARTIKGLKHDREIRDEFTVKRKNGTEFPVQLTLALRTSSQGKTVGIIGSAVDITERKKAEEALRESELRYRLLAENANDIIFTTDLSLKPTYFSPSVTRLRGYTTREAMSQTPAQVLTPASLKVVNDALNEEIEIEAKGGKKFRHTRTLQLEMTCKDGSTVWTETTFSSLRDKDMTPVGFLGITRDISERRRNEDALKESEERFRTLFESSKDAILVVTVSGDIVAINSAGLDLFGYAEHEIGSINTASFYPDPEERACFREKIERDGYLKDYEIIYRKKDGTLLDCLETATAIRDERGAIVGYQGTIRDISEHRKMEKRLMQAEKLSSLGGMISGVAHELNNPLTSIIGNAQLLMRKEIPLDFRNKLEIIQRESIRCTKIVGGLLSFAREHRPERRMIDINTVVAESLLLREYDLRVNNIRVVTDLVENIPQTSADPYQLQQVFVNLINNSHDALAEKGGGTLSIRSFSKDGSIYIVFADDGPGISPDDLNRVFDPFFTTRDIGKGTGLGLSIAYGIINEHGGTIDAESRRGKGSTFTVRIPVVEQYEPPITNSGVISPAAAPKKRRILVVEDEEPLRKILIESLTEEGYGVKGVPNGQEAIGLLKIVRFDCIISDLKMPGIGGKQLYEFIRKHTPDLSGRVLFMTGDVLGKDTQRFLRDTGNPYIEKPFELSQLFSLVQKLFSGLK